MFGRVILISLRRRVEHITEWWLLHGRSTRNQYEIILQLRLAGARPATVHNCQCRLGDGAGIYPAGILCGSEIERTFWNSSGWAELTRLSWSCRTKKKKKKNFPGGEMISEESSEPPAGKRESKRQNLLRRAALMTLWVTYHIFTPSAPQKSCTDTFVNNVRKHL